MGGLRQLLGVEGVLLRGEAASAQKSRLSEIGGVGVWVVPSSELVLFLRPMNLRSVPRQPLQRTEWSVDLEWSQKRTIKQWRHLFLSCLGWSFMTQTSRRDFFPEVLEAEGSWFELTDARFTGSYNSRTRCQS